MGKTFKERLERLDDIKLCLKEERKFYLSQRDWPRVKVTTESLRRHAEQVAKVLHLMGKDSFKSA